MCDAFVFGDIIVSENSNNTTYELTVPYYNSKLQKGEMFITTSSHLYQVTPQFFPDKIGAIHLSVDIGYGQYISAIASFVPQGPTGPIGSQTIISKPIVIKSKVKPQTTQDGDGLVHVIQPANISQAPTLPENSFNVSIVQVSIIFVAFLLLLIFLYIGWRKEKEKK